MNFGSGLFNSVKSAITKCSYLQSAGLRTQRKVSAAAVSVKQEILPDTTFADREITKDVTETISKEILSPGRLFAVVNILNNQFKITQDDVLCVKGTFYPNVGDQIYLEKVLLVGGLNFTLVGRPLLSQPAVRVKATVIEKTLSHKNISLFWIPRRRYRRTQITRTPLTMLRINSIEVKQP